MTWKETGHTRRPQPPPWGLALTPVAGSLSLAALHNSTAITVTPSFSSHRTPTAPSTALLGSGALGGSGGGLVAGGLGLGGRGLGQEPLIVGSVVRGPGPVFRAAVAAAARQVLRFGRPGVGRVRRLLFFLLSLMLPPPGGLSHAPSPDGLSHTPSPEWRSLPDTEGTPGGPRVLAGRPHDQVERTAGSAG